MESLDFAVFAAAAARSDQLPDTFGVVQWYFPALFISLIFMTKIFMATLSDCDDMGLGLAGEQPGSALAEEVGFVGLGLDGSRGVGLGLDLPMPRRGTSLAQIA